MPTDWWRGPRRLDVPEQMDEAAVDVDELKRALKFIRRVNAWLGYTRATIGHLDRLTRDLPADKPLTILDVATGSADVPVAILKWAKRRGRNVNVVGLDLHERTLEDAAENAGPAVPLVRGDALSLPYADGAFDVVMTSMFLHHLPTETAAAVLREMNRVARRAVIAADLVRDRRAYRWICLFTAMTSPMVKHDARVSVKQAFTLEEAERLRAMAGLENTKVFKHFGHRFVIAGRSSDSLSR